MSVTLLLEIRVCFMETKHLSEDRTMPLVSESKLFTVAGSVYEVVIECSFLT